MDAPKDPSQWWDAHTALEHRHTELTKRVDIHQEAIKQLADQQRDNHVEVMSAITRVERYVTSKDKLGPGQALVIFAIFFLLLVITIGVFR